MHSVQISPAPVEEKAAPLIVDLERDLLKTNALTERLLVILKQNPLYALLLPLWFLRGRAFFEQQSARFAALDAGLLPYRQNVLDYLKMQRAQGRAVLLTGRNAPVARSAANHLAVFDGVVAMDGAAAVASEIGDRFPAPKRHLPDYLKPLRLQHWLKNLLVFVPVFAAHRFLEAALLAKTFVAFLAFGCCASSGYLVNDLLDLGADRRHPQKRLRSFAAGELPLGYGLAMIPLLASLGCLIGFAVSPLLAGALLLYMAVTTAYSFWMRKAALLDVIALAGLYTVRILAGSAAVAIWPSHFLLEFSTFLFLSLALVKRYGELVIMRNIDGDNAKARGYQLSDEELLASMGVASGYLAVFVFASYIHSPAAHALYSRYELMWLLCPLLLYWISHVWLTAHRGKMPDDPLVFATHNRTSRVVMALMLAVILLAL